MSCNEMPIGFVFANLAARSFQKVVLSIHYSFKYSDLSLLMQVESYLSKISLFSSPKLAFKCVLIKMSDKKE